MDHFFTCPAKLPLRVIYRVSQKKLYTFQMAAEWKIFDSGENDLHVWIAYGLNFHLTPKRLKIIHAWMSTAHFCKGYEN